MNWIRSSVRSACVLLALVGSAFSGRAAPSFENDLSPVSSLPAPTASATLAQAELTRRLHDTRPLGLETEAAIRRLYAAAGYTTFWTHDSGWTDRATLALQLLGQAAEVGLDRRRYAWARLAALPDSLRRAAGPARGRHLASFELHLTDALLRYAQHLRRGCLDPVTLLPAPPDTAAARQAALLLHHSLAHGSFPNALEQVQPRTRSYRLLQAAWSRTLQQASTTDSLRLMQDTVAGFRRVAINLERLRWDATAADNEYALVNIPAYRMQVVQGGQVLQTHRVIVGKPELPTPVLSSRIIVFVTAPEWRVPYSIAVRELLPELQRDPGFLYDHQYRLYDGRGRRINPWHVNWQRMTPEKFAYSVRQLAGRQNALGNVVFYFPNQHTVFLHDTPARTAFTQTTRALSHGCVRVENPLKLAEYLLRREGQADLIRPMYTSVKSRTKQRFDLAQGLPIYIRYYTCETDQGRLRFLPDVYGLDAPLQAAFFRNNSE